MKARVTKHAKKRGKQRIGVKKKDVQKNAQEAMDFGITFNEAKGNLKRYMTKIYLKNEIPNNMRVYNHRLYLFRESLLITVLDIPPDLCRVADSLQRKKKEQLEAKNQTQGDMNYERESDEGKNHWLEAEGA